MGKKTPVPTGAIMVKKPKPPPEIVDPDDEHKYIKQAERAMERLDDDDPDYKDM